MEAFDSEHIDTLKAFPVFKLAGSASPEQHAEPAFASLSAKHKLPPSGTEPALLGPEFLVQPLPGEAEVLRQRLGVSQVSHTTFLIEHIFHRRVSSCPWLSEAALPPPEEPAVSEQRCSSTKKIETSRIACSVSPRLPEQDSPF